MVHINLIVAILLSIPITSVSKQAMPARSKNVPCGILKKFEGEVQILDASRTNMIDTVLKASVPCGGWVSVQSGWAEIQHRQGFKLKLGPHTFIELFDNHGERKYTGKDHIVLYKGKIHALVKNGMGELRVITANSRTIANHSVFVVNFNQWNEESQVIVLEGKASFENRFETSRQVEVAAGEATQLNFRTLRVVPATSRAIKLSSLKQKIKDLPLSEREAKAAKEAATRRGKRKFASLLVEKKRRRRIPASQKQGKNFKYERYPAAIGEGDAKKDWMNRVTGGADIGVKELFPKKKRKPGPQSQKVLDPATTLNRQQKARDLAEKKKVIKELSELRDYGEQ